MTNKSTGPMSLQTVEPEKLFNLLSALAATNMVLDSKLRSAQDIEADTEWLLQHIAAGLVEVRIIQTFTKQAKTFMSKDKQNELAQILTHVEGTLRFGGAQFLLCAGSAKTEPEALADIDERVDKLITLNKSLDISFQDFLNRKSRIGISGLAVRFINLDDFTGDDNNDLLH